MDPSSRQKAKYTARHFMGVVSDKTAVGLAKLKGYEFQEIDIAIVKATLQDEVVPKEKHVRTLKINCPASAPRQQVMYIIRSLADRIQKGQGWLVTLKTLMVFHRLMREVDQSFQDELLKFQERYGPRHILRLDTYADHTTKDTWDYSSWIRCYSIYLDERLEAFKALKFDPEQDNNERDTRLKNCEAPELLELLPRAQRLLGRLVACLPEGAAVNNIVVNQAAAWVLKESRAVYRLASEGVMNLADKYFEMSHADALKGLELYRENVSLNERMNRYYATVQQNSMLRGVITFPTLQSLPADFLTTMEEYIKEAPRSLDPNAMPRSATRAAPATSVALAAAPEPEPAAVEEPKPAAPVVDLLDFGPDTPKAASTAPAAAAPAGPANPLDALLDPSGNHASTSNGFGDSAFNGSAAPAPAPQQQNGFAPNPMAQSYDPQMTGYAPQMTGYAPQMTGYAPQMTGYMPQMTGMDPYGYNSMGMGMAPGMYGAPGFGGPAFGQNPGAESTALVLYQGPQMGFGGMGAPNPFMAMPPRAPSSSGNNPFRTSLTGGAAPPANPMFEARKMANDPLNAISDDLFQVKQEAPKPSVPLNAMKRQSQNGEGTPIVLGQ